MNSKPIDDMIKPSNIKPINRPSIKYLPVSFLSAEVVPKPRSIHTNVLLNDIPTMNAANSSSIILFPPGHSGLYSMVFAHVV